VTFPEVISPATVITLTIFSVNRTQIATQPRESDFTGKIGSDPGNAPTPETQAIKGVTERPVCHRKGLATPATPLNAPFPAGFWTQDPNRGMKTPRGFGVSGFRLKCGNTDMRTIQVFYSKLLTNFT